MWRQIPKNDFPFIFNYLRKYKHYINKIGKSPSPLLHLQNFQITLQTSAKFLGLTFHSNSSWTPRIKILKAKCLNSLNIIKYLSHLRTGCNRRLFLQLYNSLIRSQLDYGAPIYRNTIKTALQMLDSIQSAALRLAHGALRTSPTLSLCAEAGVPHYRSAFYLLLPTS